jgi:hypothetical protein
MRTNPYVPSFSSTPARIAEPAAGASVCAGGSQVWNGTVGVLMASPTNTASNTSVAAVPPPARGFCSVSSTMSNVCGSAAR